MKLPALLLMLSASSSAAQMATIITVPCEETKSMLDSLAKDFNENPIGTGITKRGDLVQIYVSDKGTFTVVRSTPNGFSCMISNGTDWNAEKPVKKGTKS